jgi:hypothetical protein
VLVKQHLTMEPSPTDSPLCSSCGLHPAHTFLTQIMNGVMTNSSLCDECASLRQVATDADDISIHDAKCYYCGDRAAGGLMNLKWELPVRKQTMHNTCFRCMELCHQFMLKALGAIPEHLSPEDQLQRMETMVGEVDSQVRSKISE